MRCPSRNHVDSEASASRSCIMHDVGVPREARREADTVVSKKLLGRVQVVCRLNGRTHSGRRCPLPRNARCRTNVALLSLLGGCLPTERIQIESVRVGGLRPRSGRSGVVKGASHNKVASRDTLAPAPPPRSRAFVLHFTQPLAARGTPKPRIALCQLIRSSVGRTCEESHAWRECPRDSA